MSNFGQRIGDLTEATSAAAGDDFEFSLAGSSGSRKITLANILVSLLALFGYYALAPQENPTQVVSKFYMVGDVRRYGAKGDGVTDDAAAIDAALASVPATGGRLYASAGTYKRSTTFNITRSNIAIVMDEGASILFTGTGVAVAVDGTGASGGLSKVSINRMDIVGNPSCTIGFRAVQLGRCYFGDIRVRECSVSAHSLEFCVCVVLDRPRCTSNDHPITTLPTQGLLLDQLSIPAQNTTDCIIINPVYEGLTGKVGIQFGTCTENTVLGGTSEANGTGINFSATSAGNIVRSFFCELNTTADVIHAGNFNVTEQGYFTSGITNTVRFLSGAYHNQLVGGQVQNIVVDAGVLSTVLDKVAYLGTITDNGAKTQKIRVWKIPAAQYDPDVISRRLLVGAYGTDTGEDIQAGGSIKGAKFATGGTSPTLSTGTGAGTGATKSVAGNDAAGTLTLTTGTSPATNTSVLNVMFGTAYAGGVVPRVQLTPNSPAAAAAVGSIYVQSDNLGFYLSVNGAALAAASTYTWHYLVVT